MSRPRRKFRLYNQESKPALQQEWTPSGFKPIKKTEDTKIIAAIKATIKKWLDSIPAFSVAYFSKYLIVQDAVYDSQLAVIDFEDDHLAVNIPRRGFPSRYLLVAEGKKVYYSDPQLHQRVKYLVNQAYNQQPSS